MENIPFLMISLTNRRGILSEISSSDRKTPLTSIIDLYKKDCFQKGNGRRKDRKPGDDNNRPTGSYTENRISRDRSEIVIPVTPAKVFTKLYSGPYGYLLIFHPLSCFGSAHVSTVFFRRCCRNSFRSLCGR